MTTKNLIIRNRQICAYSALNLSPKGETEFEQAKCSEDTRLNI